MKPQFTESRKLKWRILSTGNSEKFQLKDDSAFFDLDTYFIVYEKPFDEQFFKSDTGISYIKNKVLFLLYAANRSQ